jgi:hypothetical protein
MFTAALILKFPTFYDTQSFIVVFTTAGLYSESNESNPYLPKLFQDPF